MNEAFVGRQPIFDRDLGVHAFELLFRQGDVGQAGVNNGDQATARVLVNTLMEIGLDRVVGSHTAFVNVPHGLLATEQLLVLPPERVVIEILEDEVVNEALVSRVRELSGAGYRIALDDFIYDPRWEPLLPIVDIVKVEVMALDLAQVARQVGLLEPYQKQLLAEKIETREDFSAYKEMGFHLFQGYFLSRPEVVHQGRLSNSKLSVLRLLAALQEPGIDIDDLEDLLRQDVSLSYKLLSYINSAFFAHSEEISTIKEAVVYLGIEMVKRWVSLVALSGVDDQPEELMRTALVRASMCERLGKLAARPGAEVYFVTGLFSALDALMGFPLPELLDRLPLSREVKTAILDYQGSMGEALRCVLEYEHCRWDRVRFAGLEEEALVGAYLESVDWAWQISSLLNSQN